LLVLVSYFIQHWIHDNTAEFCNSLLIRSKVIQLRPDGTRFSAFLGHAECQHMHIVMVDAVDSGKKTKSDVVNF